MAFLFLFFTVALSLCVVGLIVLALSSILASVRDDWRLKKPKREPRPGEPDYTKGIMNSLVSSTDHGGGKRRAEGDFTRVGEGHIVWVHGSISGRRP